MTPTRKTKLVRITDDNRDKGKLFLITEMSALAAERWALRAYAALARSGVDVSDLKATGMAGIVTLGVKALAAGIAFEDVEPLLEEMLGCVKIAPNSKDPSAVRPLVFDEENPDGDDIQEPSTLIKLRVEAFNLHVDFSSAGAKSK